jgi:hypothetical protein
MNKKYIFLITIILFFILVLCWNYFIGNEYFDSLQIDSDTEFYNIEIHTSSRLGNFLSCYFYNMGLAFLHGKHFQTTIGKTGDMFTDNFPEKVSFDKSVQDAFISVGITDELLKTQLDTFDGNCHSAWNIVFKETEMFWTIMKPTINRILKDALEKNNMNKMVDAPVIHYRCSDSPINKLEYYYNIEIKVNYKLHNCKINCSNKMK